MTATSRRVRRGVVALSVVLAALAAAAPFLDAGRFRDWLRTALENTLHRQVRLADVHYRVFPALGLTATNVVISEDPDFGLDATAYVDDLAVELRWSALLTGRMEVAAVRLNDASINLARSESGEWAFRKLFTRSITESSQPPRFVVRNGRINFRTGTMKSPFYLNAVDLELAAEPGADGGFEWRYEASPARTDRAEQGFGRFSGSGQWHPGESGGVVDIELSLERSATAEVSMLLASRDVGIPGRVWSQARLFGPLSKVRVTGSLQFEGLERSGLFSFRDARLSIPYEGFVDVPAQRLELATLRPKEADLPLSAEFRGVNFLGNFTREVVFRFDKMPAKTLVEISRRLGQTTPDGLAVEGVISGTISAGDSGVTGEIEVSGPRVTFRAPESIQAESAQISIRNEEVRLAPVRVTAGEIVADLEGGWRTTNGALQFIAQVTDLPMAGLRAASGQLPGAHPFPLPVLGETGRVSGTIRFDSGLEGEPWSGEFTLAGGRAEVAGVTRPVEIRRADIRLKGDQWSLRGIQASAEGIPFGADFTHTPGLRRPDHVTLKVREVDAENVEEMFGPALARDRGILERALRFRSDSVPAWLRTRHAEVRFVIDTLHAGEQELENVRATMFWDGARAEFPDVVAQWSGAVFRGHLRADLTQTQPSYWLKGQLEGLAWLGGQVDFDLEARASGTGEALPASLNLASDFRALNVQAGEEAVRQASGLLEVQPDRSGPRARIKSLEVVSGSDVMAGQGTISGEGRIAAEVSNARRSLRLAFDIAEAKGSGK